MGKHEQLLIEAVKVPLQDSLAHRRRSSAGFGAVIHIKSRRSTCPGTLRRHIRERVRRRWTDSRVRRRRRHALISGVGWPSECTTDREPPQQRGTSIVLGIGNCLCLSGTKRPCDAGPAGVRSNRHLRLLLFLFKDRYSSKSAAIGEARECVGLGGLLRHEVR